MYFNKFGVDRNTFLTYPKITQQRLLNIAPEYRYEKINDGKRIDVLRFDVNDPEGKGVSIYSADIAGDPDFFKISMPSPDDPNVQISSIVDISTEDGRAMVAQINEINKKCRARRSCNVLAQKALVCLRSLCRVIRPEAGLPFVCLTTAVKPTLIRR